MQKILTISIAAYNVEEYLDTLMNSIIKADRNEELEVLIINDGSKDSTLQKAKKYAEDNPDTIIVVDKENGGHGSTINKGIKLATGKYFKIIDGDDWVESEGLANLVDYLKEAYEDMVLTDYRECYMQSNAYKNMRENFAATRKAISIGQVIDFTSIADTIDRLQMHMITFKTELLKDNNICVDEHCFYVDTEYVFYVLPHIKTASYLDCTVYCYRLGREGQSMTSESLRKHAEDHIRVNLAIIRKYGRCENAVSDGVRRQMDTLVYNVTMLTYRILLSMNYNKALGEKIRSVDEHLLENNPNVYYSFTEKWLLSFRKSQYKHYLVAWCRGKIKSLVEHVRGL